MWGDGGCVWGGGGVYVGRWRSVCGEVDVCEEVEECVWAWSVCGDVECVGCGGVCGEVECGWEVECGCGGVGVEDSIRA